MSKRRSSQGVKLSGGFTLIEVMVAMMIVAVGISALLYQTMNTIDNTAYLRDKTIAQWVALNQLELVYLENQNTNRLINRERSGTETMAGQEWYWQLKPERTAGDNFIQVKVSVRAAEDDESAIATISGIIDTNHKPGR